MFYKFLNILGTVAFFAIFAGIWLTDVSLGSKIIWTSLYTIFLCAITMHGNETTKVKKTLCDFKHKL